MPHPESLVLESLLYLTPQYPKLPQPESHTEHTNFTTLVLHLLSLEQRFRTCDESSSTSWQPL